MMARGREREGYPVQGFLLRRNKPSKKETYGQPTRTNSHYMPHLNLHRRWRRGGRKASKKYQVFHQGGGVRCPSQPSGTVSSEFCSMEKRGDGEKVGVDSVASIKDARRSVMRKKVERRRI